MKQKVIRAHCIILAEILLVHNVKEVKVNPTKTPRDIVLLSHQEKPKRSSRGQHLDQSKKII